MEANFSNTLKKSVEFSGLTLGDHLSDHGPAERLAAALNGGDQDPKHPELPFLVHEITQDRYTRINTQRDDDRADRAKSLRQVSEEDREGSRQELDHQQRPDQCDLVESELVSVRGSHHDDGADPVGIHPKREHPQGEIVVMTDISEGLSQAAETGCERFHVLLANLDPAGRFFDMPEEGQGENKPPDRHGEKTKSGQQGFIHTQGIRQDHDHSQVDGKQNSTPDVAHGIPAGGHLVDLVRPRNMR